MVRDSETFIMTCRWTVNVLQSLKTDNQCNGDRRLKTNFICWDTCLIFFHLVVTSSLDLNFWDIYWFACHPFWIEKQKSWKLNSPTSIAKGPFKEIIRILIIQKETLDLFFLIIWYFISNTLSSHLPEWDVWELGIKKVVSLSFSRSIRPVLSAVANRPRRKTLWSDYVSEYVCVCVCTRVRVCVCACSSFRERCVFLNYK